MESLFHTVGLFLHPLKISENNWFSDVFKGIGEGQRQEVS